VLWIDHFRREYYAVDPTLLLDIAHDVKLHLMYRAASFSEPTWYMLWAEHDQYWKRYYLPSDRVPREGLILDAGAGEGESILFLSRYGFENFVAIESDTGKYDRLVSNTRRLNVRIVNRELTPEDLKGVDFAKIDVDGGEECLLDLEEPKCELVLELHSDDLLRKFMDKWPRLQLLTETQVQSVYLTRLRKSDA